MTGLETIRKDRGFTLKDLENLSGIHSVTLSRIERGKIDIENVTLRNAIRLAKALECEPFELV